MSAKIIAKIIAKMSALSGGSVAFRRIERRFQNTHFSRTNLRGVDDFSKGRGWSTRPNQTGGTPGDTTTLKNLRFWTF